MASLSGSPSSRVGAGLGIAAFAQLLSLFLAGAGHGWVAPLSASLLLWVMTPLALLLAWPRSGAAWETLLPMLVIGVIADAWLVYKTIGEDNALALYLEVNGLVGVLIVALWVGSWLFWQGLVLTRLFVRKAAR